MRFPGPSALALAPLFRESLESGGESWAGVSRLIPRSSFLSTSPNPDSPGFAGVS